VGRPGSRWKQFLKHINVQKCLYFLVMVLEEREGAIFGVNGHFLVPEGKQYYSDTSANEDNSFRVHIR